MNIGIDARVLEKKMTGVGRLLLEFLHHIPDIDKKNRYFLFSYNKIDVGNDYYRTVQTIPTGSKSKFYSPLWLIGVLPRYLREYKIDIFFTPNVFAPIRSKFSKWRSVIVIHDTFNKVDRRYQPFWYNTYLDVIMPISIRQSSAVLTISQNSKSDICKYYGTDPKKIFLAYRAAEARFHPRAAGEIPLERLRQILTVDGEFILYVGMIEKRKNITTIIDVADRLASRGIAAPIILVGQRGNGGEELIREIRRRNNMIYLSYVEDELLPFLYNAARVFFFPSLYEGFGLPPLEAMQSGTPVVVSNSSSLPEVVEEGGIQCDPFDSAAFASGIERLLLDADYYALMREKGIAQAQKFKAKTASVQLVDLFNSLQS